MFKSVITKKKKKHTCNGFRGKLKWLCCDFSNKFIQSMILLYTKEQIFHLFIRFVTWITWFTYSTISMNKKMSKISHISSIVQRTVHHQTTSFFSKKKVTTRTFHTILCKKKISWVFLYFIHFDTKKHLFLYIHTYRWDIFVVVVIPICVVKMLEITRDTR